MMASVKELLERVRVVSGPDRELDGLIAKLAGEMPHDAMWMAENVYGQVTEQWYTGGYGDYNFLEPPAYTASIDAALALTERLLPGWKWGVSSHSIRDGVYADGPYVGKPKHADGFRAHVTERSALRPMPAIADAPTPPLAILAALLSSLSTKEG